MQNRRFLPLLAFLSSLLIVLAVSCTPQSLFSDPAWQLKALQQYLAGGSPTLGTLVQADPRDVSQDAREWISWWPIGTTLLVYPLLRMGLTIGADIRVLASLALIAGSIGFGYWLRVFRLPQRLATALAISIRWILGSATRISLYASTPPRGWSSPSAPGCSSVLSDLVLAGQASGWASKTVPEMNYVEWSTTLLANQN